MDCDLDILMMLSNFFHDDEIFSLRIYLGCILQIPLFCPIYDILYVFFSLCMLMILRLLIHIIDILYTPVEPFFGLKIFTWYFI